MRYVLAALIMVPFTAHAAPLLGINMSGLEMGSGTIASKNYGVPTPPFTGNMPGSVQVMRVPFRMSRAWQSGALDRQYVGFLQDIGAYCTSHGIVPIYDDHEYGTTAGLDIATAAGQAALVSEWKGLVGSLPAGSAIDLMNEPKKQANSDLVTTYNAVIAAVRSAGFTGLIFVEPTRYARAAQVTAAWTDFDGITDPDRNTDLEVHWYLDPSDTGNGRDPVSPTLGAAVMEGVVAYQRSGRSPFRQVLLGETGVAQAADIVDAAQTAALTNELAVIRDNPSVFYGVTLWAAGPWWPAKYPLDENTATNAGYLIAEQVFEPLTVYLSEDADGGDAFATIAVDGVQAWSGTVTADRLTSAPQPISIPGSASLAAGAHTVSVRSGRKADAAAPTSDPHLFVDGASWRGARATSQGFFELSRDHVAKFPVTVY